MDKYFYSPKNIDKLARALLNSLPVEKTEKKFEGCKILLKKNMDSVFSQYGKKCPKDVPIPTFIDKLSERSLKESIKTFHENAKIKTTGNVATLKKKKGKVIGTFNNSSLGDSFAPLTNSPLIEKDGAYVSAYGDVLPDMRGPSGSDAIGRKSANTDEMALRLLDS